MTDKLPPIVDLSPSITLCQIVKLHLGWPPSRFPTACMSEPELAQAKTLLIQEWASTPLERQEKSAGEWLALRAEVDALMELLGLDWSDSVMLSWQQKHKAHFPNLTINMLLDLKNRLVKAAKRVSV